MPRLTAGSSNLTLTGTAPVTGGGALDLRADGRGRPRDDRAADCRQRSPRRGPDEARRPHHRHTGGAAHRRHRAARRRRGAGLQRRPQSCERLRPPSRRTASTSGSPGSPPRPGPGTIGGSGTIGLAAPMPVDLTFTAQNATPVANEMLTERLDANLTIAGEAAGQSDGAGHGAGAPGGPADPG